MRWIEFKARDGYVPFSGICPKCGSKDFWDDETWFGCNNCGWSHPQ